MTRGERPSRRGLGTAVEQIVESSGTPYFSFKDLDENKPAGSIKLRVETIHYFLQRYRERPLRGGSRASRPQRSMAPGART